MLSQEEIDQFKSLVSQEIGQATQGMETDIQAIANEVKKISGLEKDVKGIKTDLGKMHKDIRAIINFFDRDSLELRGRIDRIEKHLGLSASP